MGAIYNLQSQLSEYKLKTEVLSGIVANMNENAADVEKRVEKLELNSMRKSMVVSGFNIVRNKKECRKELANFFEDEMGILPEIDDIFFITPESTNPMIVSLTYFSDKLLIYKNTTKIKDLVNEDEKPFFFTDYLPQEMSEKRRRENEIYKNNMKAADNQIEMSRKGGKLLIEQQPYRKKIHIPTVDIYEHSRD